MKKKKEMKRRDYQYKFYNCIACIKWYNKKSVMILGSHLEEITSVSILKRRLKGSSSKIPVNGWNGVKLYSSKMGGVDLMDQMKSAYQIDRRSKFRFYLRLFFDLFDVAIVNSFIVHKKLENKDLTLKEVTICIALKLIVFFVSWKLSCLHHRPSNRTKAQRPSLILPSHLPVLLETRRRCTVCFQAGIENRTFITCSLCNIALSLQVERNCYNITHKPAVTHILKTLL